MLRTPVRPRDDPAGGGARERVQLVVHREVTDRPARRIERRIPGVCSPVRYVTVWSCLVVLTKHGAAGALPGAAEGWRVPDRRPGGPEKRERSRRKGGTTSPSVVSVMRVQWPDESARRFTRARRSALVWVWGEQHGHLRP